MMYMEKEITASDINVMLATLVHLEHENGDKQLSILLFTLLAGCKQCNVSKEVLIDMININWSVEIPIGAPIIPARNN